MNENLIFFKSIKFYNYKFKRLLLYFLNGGYLTAPAASALSKIFEIKNYYFSLRRSNLVIFDSGFFCILLRLLKKTKVKKMSGYLFLNFFLKSTGVREKKIFLINPNQIENNINYNFLRKKNFFKLKCYIAPKYLSKIVDKKLISILIKNQPQIIIINIGGETQEQLANYIFRNINFKISILCTGAAIAFMTKQQAPINEWIDKYYLGWFVRLLFKPKIYYLRLIESFKLVKLFF